MKYLMKINWQTHTNTYFFNKIKVLTLISFVALAFWTCSNDDSKDLFGDCGSSNYSWVSLVQKELKAWNTAATTYASAQTLVNCNMYKGATNDYLNALEKAKKCVPEAGLIEFNQAIQFAREDLKQLDCP